ncbi:ribonuclease H-like domain-containing protein [Tanacetum coccineum]
MSDSEEQFAYAMQLVTSISLPMVLLNATKLKVLVTIAKAGPNVGLSAHEIASHLSISNQNAREMLDRMLWLLASHSILTFQQICLYMHDSREPHLAALKLILRYVQGTLDLGLHLYASFTTSLVGYTDADWAGCPSTRSAKVEYRSVANVVAETAWLCKLLRELHSPLSNQLLSKLCLTAGQVQVLHVPSRFQYADIFTKGLPSALFEEFGSSLSAVLEGGTPFDKVHETSGFEYMGLDARFNKIFNKAIVDTSIIVIKEVLNCYHGFENLKSLVNIGGGLGITLNMIISKHPKIKGINLDLPHVIQHAPQFPEHGKVIVVDKILPVLPDTSSYVKC